MIATTFRCGCEIYPDELERSLWCSYHTGMLDGLCMDPDDNTDSYVDVAGLVADDARRCHDDEIDR